MREILFRGKRMDNGEWVEGNLFLPDKKETPTEICMGTNIVRINFDINPETVGQYTGLEDKNGEKIFEGDVLELDGEDGFFEVEYDDDRAMFVICGDYTTFYFDNLWNEVEVIGNIYDHPELMGGAEE